MVSEGRRRQAAPLLIAIAVALGIAGQRSFAAAKPLLVDGILLYVTAIAALVAAVSILGAEPRPLRPPLPTRERLTLSAALRWWPRILGLATALVTVLFALAQLRRGSRDSYLAPFLLWVTAIASYLLATALPGRPLRATPATDRLEEPPRLPRYVWLVPLALAALAFALRFYRVADIPPTLGGDEANQGLDGVKVLTGEIRNPFGLGWLGVPAMAGYWIAAAISVFGRNMFALRLPAVIVGTATIVISYYLVRRLQSSTTAWLTAALLATYGFHVHFSRLGAVTQVLDGFFVSLSLLFLVRAVQDGRRLDWALSGAVAGLAQYSYAGARLTPLLLLVLAAAHLVLGGRAPRTAPGREGFRRHGIGALVLFGAFVVVAAPMIQLALRDPDNYNARLNSVGILQNGWLESEIVIRGDSRAVVLLDQFKRAALGFNVYQDRTTWYGLRGPLMGFLPSIFFLLGIGYGTCRLFDLRLLPMTAWWWGAVLTGGMLTVDPPSSMRLVTLTVPSCFFAALALERCSSVLSRALRPPARATVAALVAIVTVIGVQNVRSYFVEYTPMLIYGNPTAVTATALGKYARDELGKDWTLVLFGAPHLISGFATIPFLAPEVEGVDIIEPLREPPPRDFVPSGKNLAFAFLPNRLAELDLVRASFPGGRVIEGPAPWPDGVPVYVLYNVRRDATGAASGL